MNGTRPYITPYSVPTTITIVFLSLSASIITVGGNVLVISSFNLEARKYTSFLELIGNDRASYIF